MTRARHAWLAIATLAPPACAREVRAVTADASPERAGSDAPDAGDAPRDDGSGAATVAFEVRVVEGGARPHRPVAAAWVRAESAAGDVVEALTDATGTARPRLAPGAGPWDITAAKEGMTAVSVLGVTGPLGDPIRLERFGAPPPAGYVGRSAACAFRNLPAGSRAHVAGEGLGFQPHDARPSVTWGSWPGASPLRAFYVEYARAGADALVPEHPSRAWRGPELSREDFRCEADFSAATPPFDAHLRLEVEPTPGLGAVRQSVRNDQGVAALRGDDDAPSRWVGDGSVRQVVGGGVEALDWRISHFGDPLAPALAWVSLDFCSQELNGCSLGALGAATVFARLPGPLAPRRLPRLPEVDAPAEVSPRASPRWAVRAPGYAHAGFFVVAGITTGEALPWPWHPLPRWVAVTYRGPAVASRGLPSLPSAVSLRGLLGGADFATARYFGVVLRDAAPAPWAATASDVEYVASPARGSSFGPR